MIGARPLGINRAAGLWFTYTSTAADAAESLPHADPTPATAYAAPVTWKPQRPRFHIVPLVIAWIGSAAGIMAAAYIVPGDSVNGFLGAMLVAALVAMLNAIAPPVIAAIRLPYTVGVGFILVLAVDALMLQAASAIAPARSRFDSLRLGAGNRADRRGGLDGVSMSSSAPTTTTPTPCA